ncbi:MAG: hypothetical protein JWP37_4408 [Mucilaginibacter sp.]|nr:hypothetical protein [Mucilaginibacter sp.]
MPIEIRELQITATVQEDGNKPSSNAAAIVDSEAIVARCVEQVLEILKEKSER